MSILKRLLGRRPNFDKWGIPIHHGPGVSDCCNVEQGQAHNPGRCAEVSPEQFAEMLRRQNATR